MLAGLVAWLYASHLHSQQLQPLTREGFEHLRLRLTNLERLQFDHAAIGDVTALREEHSKLRHDVTKRMDDVDDNQRTLNLALENTVVQTKDHLARFEETVNRAGALVASHRPGMMRGVGG